MGGGGGAYGRSAVRKIYTMYRENKLTNYGKNTEAQLPYLLKDKRCKVQIDSNLMKNHHKYTFSSLLLTILIDLSFDKIKSYSKQTQYIVVEIFNATLYVDF